MNEMDLRESLGRTTGGMDMLFVLLAGSHERRVEGTAYMTTKVPTPLKSLVDWQISEILAPEGDNLALGHEKRELVLAGVGELGKLDTLDFGTDRRRKLAQLRDTLGQEVGEARVGVLAMLIVLEWSKRWVGLGGIPRREVVGVFGRPIPLQLGLWVDVVGGDLLVVAELPQLGGGAGLDRDGDGFYC